MGTGHIDEAGKGRGTTGTCGGNLLHADTSPSSRGRSLCRGFAHAECAKANLRLVSHTTSCAIGTDPHTVGPAGPGSWQRLPPRGRQAAAFKISNSERACTSLLAGFPESESAHLPVLPRRSAAHKHRQTQRRTTNRTGAVSVRKRGRRESRGAAYGGQQQELGIAGLCQSLAVSRKMVCVILGLHRSRAPPPSTAPPAQAPTCLPRPHENAVGKNI